MNCIRTTNPGKVSGGGARGENLAFHRGDLNHCPHAPYSALEREAQRKLQLPREVRLARDFAKLAAAERHVGAVEQRPVHGV